MNFYVVTKFHVLRADWRTHGNTSISKGSVDRFFIIYSQNYQLLQVLSAPAMVPIWSSTVTCVKGKGFLFFHCRTRATCCGQHCLHVPKSFPFHGLYRNGMLCLSGFPTI
ncbi:Uncharacterized protein TCM_008742 isoform 1 [Theobroma cacao]|uniref:Uncharacterized protein isoform 1 n=1 Tax=Theobroma cacao TaxID=3641 RepID=A0A061E5A2_THECC|nr:Uncharacterized protein TCM_008742 isoform 1 [Theobroma cacao]EOX99802.1 Uncharacterized protein TCM_008742 isoform 1 [Theobroma cacao]